MCTTANENVWHKGCIQHTMDTPKLHRMINVNLIALWWGLFAQELPTQRLQIKIAKLSIAEC